MSGSRFKAFGLGCGFAIWGSCELYRLQGDQNLGSGAEV